MSITPDMLQTAAEHLVHVVQANAGIDIHTLTMEASGYHGGADLVVKGTIAPGADVLDWVDIVEKFEVH